MSYKKTDNSKMSGICEQIKKFNKKIKKKKKNQINSGAEEFKG